MHPAGTVTLAVPPAGAVPSMVHTTVAPSRTWNRARTFPPSRSATAADSCGVAVLVYRTPFSVEPAGETCGVPAISGRRLV